jgi:hypothetical protein
MLLLMMVGTKTLDQWCQNLMIIIVGWCFLQTDHLELNKKVSRKIDLDKEKRRNKSKKNRYLFEHPSRPPNRRRKGWRGRSRKRKGVYVKPPPLMPLKKRKLMVQQFDILLQKWKKKLASKMAERVNVRANEGAGQALIAATDLPSAYSPLTTESPVNYAHAPRENEGLRGEIYVANCSHVLPIVFDTGCSMSVSPIREDFVGDLK